MGVFFRSAWAQEACPPYLTLRYPRARRIVTAGKKAKGKTYPLFASTLADANLAAEVEEEKDSDRLYST